MLFNWLATWRRSTVIVIVSVCALRRTIYMRSSVSCTTVWTKLRLHWQFILRRFFRVVVVYIQFSFGYSTFNDEKILSTCCQKVEKEKIQRLFHLFIEISFESVFNSLNFLCCFFSFFCAERHNGRRRIAVIFVVYGSCSWTISKARARKGGRIIESPIHRM